MKQLFCSVVLLFWLLQVCAYSQISGKPVLMAELPDNVDGLDVSNYLNKISIKALDNFNKSPNGIIAVKVCSSEPLPIALFFGVDNPLINVPIFSKEYFEVSKNSIQKEIKTEIFFLRTDKNCKSHQRGFPTQWWFVPEGADFPEFVEYKKMDDISISHLIYENYPPSNEDKFVFQINSQLLKTEKDVEATSENYTLAEKKIAELLKKNLTAYLLIAKPNTLSAFRREKKIIDPKAIALRSFLNKQGIGNHRIFIRECSRCFSYMYQSKSKDLYPEVSIIY